MTNILHAHHIAHGDLQHENIIIDSSGKMFLIDYDSMFIPNLNGESDIISGKKDYQHPNRIHNRIASEKLDYFSELIIYISILAIASDPTLVDRYKLKDADRLLFAKEDFEDIGNSQIYSDLKTLGGKFPLLLKIVVEYLAEQDINNLKPFQRILDQYCKEPVIMQFGFAKGKTLIKGRTEKIEWKVENASEIYLNGKRLDPTLTSFNFKSDITGEKKFELHIVNGLKEETARISIQIVEEAEVIFSADKDKLKEGKEKDILLSWNVKNSKKAELEYNGKSIAIPLSGEKNVHCTQNTDFILKATGLDGSTITTSSLAIRVIKECEIQFLADKNYTLSGVPVLLSWIVTDANLVELNGKVVSSIDSETVEPSTDTIYVLKATDEFGETKRKIKISILPTPVIKSIMVPMPQIAQNISITNCVPRHNVDVSVKLPNISPPQIRSITPTFAIENPKVKYPDKLQTLSIDIGTGFWKRLKTAINIVSNELEKLKFSEDGREKRNI